MIEYENLYLTNKKFTDAYRTVFDEILNSGWFILGKNVKRFEDTFASYCKSNYCIGVANGLDALFLSLKALNLRKGDEVIVPSNTYIATILAIINAGLQPVLVEPDFRTYNLDPKRIESHITSRTKVIIPVHLYGKLADMKAIKHIADKHNIYIIEDCAQSHGAKYKNQMAGSFGDLGAYSFYPTKNMGALGDAGAVITNEKSLANKIQQMRNYGSEKKYYFKTIGFNSRLDEIQAAFLSIKIKALNDIITHKRKLAKLYFDNLKKDFILPVIDKNYFDVYHIFAIRHPERDRLKNFMEQKGIKTEIHYPIPPYKQKAMKGILSEMNFPVSDEIHATILSLPIAYFHTEDDVSFVIETMNKF